MWVWDCHWENSGYFRGNKDTELGGTSFNIFPWDEYCAASMRERRDTME